MAGRLITFEGIDGSGKTTQINLLASKLEKEKIPFLIVREPGDTKLSEKIREILLDKKNNELTPISESLLFVAARSQLMFEKIIPALKKNKLVICDRFIDSTVAYQGYGRGLDIEYLEKLNFFGTYGKMPNLTFVFDINPDIANLRIKKKNPDRMESSGVEFYSKVQQGYYEIVKKDPVRCRLVDGSASVENLFNTIWLFINEKILKGIS